jgi:transcription antitermination factor NusG
MNHRQDWTHTCPRVPFHSSGGDRQNAELCAEWFAVFTAPQNERAVAKHLEVRSIESFLPTYEETHVWKNRQRKKIVQPLFPTYLFVRIERAQRSRVLELPGVLRMIGNSHGPLAIPNAEIEFLHSDLYREKLEPYRELAIGQMVRVKCGALRGVQGVLVRKKDSLRFVLTIGLINQHVAVEVRSEDLETVPE